MPAQLSQFWKWRVKEGYGVGTGASGIVGIIYRHRKVTSTKTNYSPDPEDKIDVPSAKQTGGSPPTSTALPAKFRAIIS
jgi:hypothetical protein